MKAIKNECINGKNLNIDFELKPNEAMIVCNRQIMEQLSRKGVTFREMYPGVFIVTSLKGNRTLQDIEKINRAIILYDPALIADGALVAQMSAEKIDDFFQQYFWSDGQKKRMHIMQAEYRGGRQEIDPGALIVTYQEGKKGRFFEYTFRDGCTSLLGYTKNDVRIEDVWDRYLFDNTVKTWLEKNKLNLVVEVHKKSPLPQSKKRAETVRTTELQEKE